MPRTSDDIADEFLVLSAQAGEPRALESLVRRWHRVFLAHAGALLHSHADALDCVQDAWIGIVRGLRRLDDPARFRAWAYRIVTNKCADRISQRRRERRDLENAESVARAAPEPEPSHDDTDPLRRAIAGLDFDRQVMLRLFYIDGLAVHEIASVLAVPAGTVKSRLHHTRNALREALERHDKESHHEHAAR